ncbi:high choriolytic enzyme 1-like [Clarias gariepinus]|uniref:high choriolytic enzyme 1-like n=1 Tax=Clarias gariepinus TaxID=13013 RepID=UPI00234E1058|nr:high choriolytic enzyme 1-like [Clarias gariepinus]
MHLILDLPLLLLLSVTLVQRCSTKASITETCHEIDNNIDKNYLSVSSRIEQANKNAGKSNRGFTIVDGDIAVNTGLQNADQCTSKTCKWPRKSNGKVYVPYVLNWQYTPSEKHIIESGLKSFTNLTCIQFVPHKNEKDFIHIMPNKGCYSHVGRQGGEQRLSLKSNLCIDFGVVQHELLHALGFHHEHSRSDRDKHVKILYENIEPEAEDNFQKYVTNNLNTSYDYNSVMHYVRDAFSKNGKPTIVPIPRSDVPIGLAKEMSKNDILRVKRLYCH